MNSSPKSNLEAILALVKARTTHADPALRSTAASLLELLSSLNSDRNSDSIAVVEPPSTLVVKSKPKLSSTTGEAPSTVPKPSSVVSRLNNKKEPISTSKSSHPSTTTTNNAGTMAKAAESSTTSAKIVVTAGTPKITDILIADLSSPLWKKREEALVALDKAISGAPLETGTLPTKTLRDLTVALAKRIDDPQRNLAVKSISVLGLSISRCAGNAKAVEELIKIHGERVIMALGDPKKTIAAAAKEALERMIRPSFSDATRNNNVKVDATCLGAMLACAMEPLRSQRREAIGETLLLVLSEGIREETGDGTDHLKTCLLHFSNTSFLLCLTSKESGVRRAAHALGEMACAKLPEGAWANRLRTCAQKEMKPSEQRIVMPIVEAIASSNHQKNATVPTPAPLLLPHPTLAAANVPPPSTSTHPHNDILERLENLKIESALSFNSSTSGLSEGGEDDVGNDSDTLTALTHDEEEEEEEKERNARKPSVLAYVSSTCTKEWNPHSAASREALVEEFRNRLLPRCPVSQSAAFDLIAAFSPKPSSGVLDAVAQLATVEPLLSTPGPLFRWVSLYLAASSNNNNAALVINLVVLLARYLDDERTGNPNLTDVENLLSSLIFHLSEKSKSIRAQIRRVLQALCRRVPASFLVHSMLQELLVLDVDSFKTGIDLENDSAGEGYVRTSNLARECFEEISRIIDLSGLEPILQPSWGMDAGESGHHTDELLSRVAARFHSTHEKETFVLLKAVWESALVSSRNNEDLAMRKMRSLLPHLDPVALSRFSSVTAQQGAHLPVSLHAPRAVTATPSTPPTPAAHSTSFSSTNLTPRSKYRKSFASVSRDLAALVSSCRQGEALDGLIVARADRSLALVSLEVANPPFDAFEFERIMEENLELDSSLESICSILTSSVGGGLAFQLQPRFRTKKLALSALRSLTSSEVLRGMMSETCVTTCVRTCLTLIARCASASDSSTKNEMFSSPSTIKETAIAVCFGNLGYDVACFHPAWLRAIVTFFFGDGTTRSNIESNKAMIPLIAADLRRVFNVIEKDVVSSVMTEEVFSSRASAAGLEFMFSTSSTASPRSTLNANSNVIDVFKPSLSVSSSPASSTVSPAGSSSSPSLSSLVNMAIEYHDEGRVEECRMTLRKIGETIKAGKGTMAEVEKALSNTTEELLSDADGSSSASSRAGATTSLFRTYALDTIRDYAKDREKAGARRISTTAELRERLNRLKAGMSS